jgi:hypothetical protein
LEKLVAGLKKFSIRMHEGMNKRMPSNVYKITTERR